MFFLKIFVFSLICLVFGAGCANTGRTDGIVNGPPRAAEAVRAERLAGLADAVSSVAVRGAGVYPEHLRQSHFDCPEEFIALLRQAGFNRLYLHFSAPNRLKIKELPDLIDAAAAAGMPVEAVLAESDYVCGRRGNELFRSFYSGGPTLETMLDAIREFESELAGPGFSGIVFIAEPHRFTASNSRRPKQIMYAWSESTYGPGLDNDMLIRISLDKAAMLAEELDGEKRLTVAFPDFFQELVDQEKLPVGGAADFLEFAPNIMIVDAGNLPTAMADRPLAALRAAEPRSALVAVPLATHTSVDRDALRRRNWNDYERSIRNAVQEWSSYPAFQGVVLGPFSEIEKLWEER